MKPSTKAKVTKAIKEYRNDFFTKAQAIAEAMQYGNEISAFNKHKFIEASHKAAAAGHIDYLLKDGSE